MAFDLSIEALLTAHHVHGITVLAYNTSLRTQVSISNFKDFFDDYRGLFSSMLVKLQYEPRTLLHRNCSLCSNHLCEYVCDVARLRDTLEYWKQNVIARLTSNSGS